MAHSLYITGTEGSSGKTVVTLGLMHFLQSQVRKVAFFRPIIDSEDEARRDSSINLILKHFELDMLYRDTYACTYKEALELVTSGNMSLLIEKIFQKYKALENEYDFVLCQGTDFRDKDTAVQFELNSEIAASLNIPLALVINGKDKSLDAIQASVRSNLELLKDKRREVGCVFVNRVSFTTEDCPTCASTIIEGSGAFTPLFFISETPALCNPSVGEVQKWMNADVLFGKEGLNNLVHDYLIAAMQVGNFMNYLEQDLLIVTPGDRSDIILASLTSHLSSTYPNIAGILLTGGIDLPESMQKLMEGWTGIPVPILSVKGATYDTCQELLKLHGKISPEDYRKITVALDAFSEGVDKETLVNKIFNFRSDRVTPMMFEFNLAEQAQKHRMRIVLPEGEELRILRAAESLCERGIADIILLGDTDAIQEKIKKFGLKLQDATIIQPTASPRFNAYAQQYYEMRKSKGLTLEQAQERMQDSTYFGTMMVQIGDADGMVSGAVPTPSVPLLKSSRRSRIPPSFRACSSCASRIASLCSATARSILIPQPASLRTSPSARRIPPVSSASNPASPCCPTPPVLPARAKPWTKSSKRPSLRMNGLPSSSLMAPSSMTRPSIPKWPERRLPPAPSPVTPPCSSSRT